MAFNMDIRPDDLSSEASRALVRLHLLGMHATSPPEHVFALNLSGLQAPGVTLWSAWDGEAIMGMCALKELDARSGELKSMRTHPDHLRRGTAKALLEHVIAEARKRGYTRLSLETGRGPAFEPALALYRRRGFVDGAPFADYRGGDFSQFLHLALV